MARCSRIIFEFIAILFIFAMVAIDFISAIIAKNCVPLHDIDTSISGAYELYYSEIFHQIEYVFIAIFCISYAWLIKACNLTKIAIYIFCFYKISTILYIFFNFEYSIYLDVVLYLCIVGISSIITLFILQLCNRKYSKLSR